MRKSIAKYESSDRLSKSRSNSKMFKGDRFIPFRGTQDHYMEEFIISNHLYQKDNKHKHNASQQPNTQDDAIRSPTRTNNQNELSNNDNVNMAGTSNS